jgi:hypothetical protein
MDNVITCPQGFDHDEGWVFAGAIAPTRAQAQAQADKAAIEKAATTQREWLDKRQCSKNDGQEDCEASRSALALDARSSALLVLVDETLEQFLASLGLTVFVGAVVPDLKVYIVACPWGAWFWCDYKPTSEELRKRNNAIIDPKLLTQPTREQAIGKLIEEVRATRAGASK